MISDAYDLPDGTTLDADLCIVGGGLAGLALARELRASGLAIVVLEGGGTEHERDSQALYAGVATLHDGRGGAHPLDEFLAESRLRALGGSGNVWGAKCALLDESDFAARAWMPGSGWPFTRADLMPFYDRACDLLGIARFDYDPESEFDAGRPPLAAGERYTTATRHFSPVRGGPGTALAE
jgi:choline dehydrogenase-like flavoprotein